MFLTFGALLLVLAVSALLFFHREAIGEATNKAFSWVVNVFRNIKDTPLPRIPDLAPRFVIVSTIVIVFGIFMFNTTYHPCDKKNQNQTAAEYIGRSLLETTGIDCGCDS
ncbi:MAG: hypothetical protein AABY15_02135 [Nanoarchaeota archaeon]